MTITAHITGIDHAYSPGTYLSDSRGWRITGDAVKWITDELGIERDAEQAEILGAFEDDEDTPLCADVTGTIQYWYEDLERTINERTILSGEPEGIVGAWGFNDGSWGFWLYDEDGNDWDESMAAPLTDSDWDDYRDA